MISAKRKRYVVTIKGQDIIQQAVIIASDLEGMYKEVYRLYGYLLKDVNGKTMGKITFKESSLT